MDTQLFITINSWAGHIRVLDSLMIFFGKYLLYLFPLLVACLWFNKKWRTRVYLAAFSGAVNRLVIVEIFKLLVHRPRPFQVMGVHQLIADNEVNVSFPSGHTVFFFSLAFAFWGTKWFWPFFILACIGSFARIFAGLHYPSDVLAGALIGAIMTIFYLNFLKRKKKIA